MDVQKTEKEKIRNVVVINLLGEISRAIESVTKPFFRSRFLNDGNPTKSSNGNSLSDIKLIRNVFIRKK